MSEVPLPDCLEGQVVAFRADASLEIGSGHVMRCLTLADALHEQGAQCHFLCREHPGHLCELIEGRGYKVHRLLPRKETETGVDADFSPEPEPAHAPWLGASWAQDATACLPILTELAPSWLVVDHYALDHRWETAVLERLSGPRPPLLVIDDLADRHHIADLLLDQNLGRQAADYRGLVPEACRVLAGPGYALLRPEFREWRAASLSRRADKPRLQRLLINLGGVDKDNVTGQVLDALTACDLPDALQISVVMGATAPWLEDIKAQAANLPWSTEVVVNVDDMARRMAEADLAIGAAGSTSWERCCLGLPTLMVVLAENQQAIAETLDDAGMADNLGMPAQLRSLSTRWLALTRPRRLARMSEAATSIVTGNGTAILCHTMREVAQEDCRE